MSVRTFLEEWKFTVNAALKAEVLFSITVLHSSADKADTLCKPGSRDRLSQRHFINFSRV